MFKVSVKLISALQKMEHLSFNLIYIKDIFTYIFVLEKTLYKCSPQKLPCYVP